MSPDRPIIGFRPVRGPGIKDFYCKELRLVIEIDGDSHDYQFEDDIIRQKRLEDSGVHFLRFTDEEVKQDMNNVLRTNSFWILDYQDRGL